MPASHGGRGLGRWYAPLAALAALGASGGVAAGAQQPARLPAVVVNATIDPPGPRKIAGVVRDTSAIPIDAVELSIPKLERRVFSGPDGGFRFEDVPPGEYSIRARKLGYAPQVQTISVDSTGGVATYMLLPVPHTLQPVVSSAARGGLSGVVGDTAFNALGGADVRVVGHSPRTRTDSLGRFYLPLDPGSYIVSVQHSGYDYRLVSVVIPPDSGRRLTVYLPPASARPVREAHNLDDFEQRLAWRRMQNSRVYTRAELQASGIEWVYDAVNMAFGSLCNGAGISCRADRDCSVILNGGPGTVELGGLTVDDIETVEIYSGGPSLPSAVAARSKGRPPRARASIPLLTFSNTDHASFANATKNCITTYVWSR